MSLLSYELSAPLLMIIVSTAVVLCCMPVTAVVLLRLGRRKNLGPTVDGAWPNVCWGREFRGVEALGALYLVHVFLSAVAALILFEVFGFRELNSTDPAAANITAALVMCGHWLVVGVIVLLWMNLRRRAPMTTFGLTRARLGQSLRIGLITLIAVMPLVAATLNIAQYVSVELFNQQPGAHPTISAVQHASAWQKTAILLLTTLAIPFFEELFYRGFIQTSLMRIGRPWVAILITGLLFGAVHLGQSGGPTEAPALAVLGFGLGYAHYRTRSLWAPVLMHVLFNLYGLGLTIGVPPLVDALRSTTPP